MLWRSWCQFLKNKYLATLNTETLQSAIFGSKQAGHHPHLPLHSFLHGDCQTTILSNWYDGYLNVLSKQFPCCPFWCNFTKKQSFSMEPRNTKHKSVHWVELLNCHFRILKAVAFSHSPLFSLYDTIYWYLTKTSFSISSYFRPFSFWNHGYRAGRDEIFYNGMHLTIVLFVKTPNKIPEGHLHWLCQFI